MFGFFRFLFFAASMLSLSLVYKCARFSFVDSHSANNKSNLIPLNLLEAIKSYMQSIFSSFFGIGTSLFSFPLHFVLVFCCTNISIDSVYSLNGVSVWIFLWLFRKFNRLILYFYRISLALSFTLSLALIFNTQNECCWLVNGSSHTMSELC